jgi:hypothetical protein
LTSAAAPAANTVVITSVVKCSMAIMVTPLYFGMVNGTTHTNGKQQASKRVIRAGGNLLCGKTDTLWSV